MKKRNFLKSLVAVPALVPMAIFAAKGASSGEPFTNQWPLKISLNAYSFNKPLREGKLDLYQLLKFCADQGFAALDPTAYYFPGYPNVPSDRYLYDFKRKAFLLGVEISGTGIRNDFSNPDSAQRKADIGLAKNWIIAAEKIGAPVIRIFSGTKVPEGHSWEEVAEWMRRDIVDCVNFGKDHGVLVAVQNHNDFIQTAEQVAQLVQMINDPWFGLVLDTGSFGTGDPYEEIVACIPFALSWQVKEEINRNGTAEKIDLKRLMAAIKSSDYRGYLPIETLGPGDPFEKVPRFLCQVRMALEQA